MTYYCTICKNLLDYERIDALKFLGKMPYDFQCFSCATIHGKKIGAVYTGLSGVSDLVFTDKVGPIRHISQEKEEVYSEPSELDIDNDDINDRQNYN